MFLSAYEPSECRARLQPDRVGDRRQMRQIGQCGSRRIFPHLPSRAGDARKPCGLRLREIAELAHVLQSAFDNLSVFSRRAATENRSLRVHVLHLLEKNHRAKCPKHPLPRPAGLFAILPGAFGWYGGQPCLADAMQKAVKVIHLSAPINDAMRPQSFTLVRGSSITPW